MRNHPQLSRSYGMLPPNEPRQANTIDQRLAAMIYACIIRASERIGGETGHHVGNRADQIQPGLNEFATAFDLSGITIGTVENGLSGGGCVQLHSQDLNAHTLWIGHHMTDGGATSRGIRADDGERVVQTDYTGTIQRVDQLETLLRARNIRLALVKMGNWAASSAALVPFDGRRHRRTDPSPTKNVSPSASRAPSVRPRRESPPL